MTHQQAIEKHAAERYLLGEMPELERYAFEAHYFTCDECADSVRTGALMADGVREGLLADAASTRRLAADAAHLDGNTPPHSSFALPGRPWLPWAVAALLAVGLGHQALWVVPDLRSQVMVPQAVEPVALRSTTRGPEPAVNLPDSGALAFALELPGVPADARLAYDLRTADGRSVASGTAVAPSLGMPLLLLVPVPAVSEAGSYALSVRAADDPGMLPVDYRFTIMED